MATLRVRTTWARDNVLLTAKRATDSLVDWAEDHVTGCLEGGESTGEASGSGDPLEHTVVWTHSGHTYTSVVRIYGTQSELDAAVDALKDAIAAHGGTVTSG